MHKRFRHLCLALAALIAAGTLLAALIPAAEAATYKKGSSGAVVSQIQTKLKNWGYYAGDVDGIYGSATERAVRAFQRKNGLTADGKAGAQTLEALGLPADSGGNSGGSGGMTGAQVDLLARLISAEARGRAQPHPASIVSEYALGRDLSERGVYLHHGRAVQRAGRGERLPRCTRRAQRGRPIRRCDLLFQSLNGHERVDLVASAHHRHR